MAAVIAVGTAIALLVAWRHIAEALIPPPPVVPAGAVGYADSYCQSLTTKAEELSGFHTIAGWVLTGVVMVGAVVVMAFVALPGDRLVAVTLVAVLGVVGLNEFKRSEAAGELTVATTEARTLDHRCATAPCANGTSDERIAFDACARAWAAWVKSRTESNGIAKAALEESLKGVKATSEKAEAQRAQAEADYQAAAETAQKNSAVSAAASAQVTDFIARARVVASAAPAPSASALQQMLDDLQKTVTTADTKIQTNVDSAAPDTVVVATDAKKDEAATECGRVFDLAKRKVDVYATPQGQYVTVLTGLPDKASVREVLAAVRKTYKTAFPGRLRDGWQFAGTCEGPTISWK